MHDRIPVTTVGRTLFDLAAVVSPGQAARAVKEAEVRRLRDSLSLADLLERHPRRPGAAALRAVIEEHARPTRSEFEDRFLLFLVAASLPRPATNVTMRAAGRWIEMDCMWREQRLIVELDGAATHLTRAAFESDRARDRALVAAGWRVMRVTWRQLRDDPTGLAETLHAALAPGPVANLRQA